MRGGGLLRAPLTPCAWVLLLCPARARASLRHVARKRFPAPESGTGIFPTRRFPSLHSPLRCVWVCCGLLSSCSSSSPEVVSKWMVIHDILGSPSHSEDTAKTIPWFEALTEITKSCSATVLKFHAQEAQLWPRARRLNSGREPGDVAVQGS